MSSSRDSSSVRSSSVDYSSVDRNLTHFFPSGLYSDLTLACGGQEFKVHRIVLHTKSPVFCALLSGKFQESATSASRIELPDDDPVYLERLLEYLYGAKFHDIAYSSVFGAQGIFSVNMYAIADKYDVPSLRKNAASQLNAFCNPDWVMDDFIAAVRAIDDLTNPEDATLWDVVLPKVQKNLGLLLEKELFKELVFDKPDFTFRFLGFLAKTSGKNSSTPPSPAPEDPASESQVPDNPFDAFTRGWTRARPTPQTHPTSFYRSGGNGGYGA